MRAAGDAGRLPARPQTRIGVCRIEREEQPARRLRVVQQVDEVGASTSGPTATPAPKCSRLVRPRRDCSRERDRVRPREAARDASSISSEQPLAAAISEAWPIEAEPGDVGARMHGTGRQALERRPRPRDSSVVIDRIAAVDGRFGRAAEFQRGRDHAGADRFGQEQHIARLRARHWPGLGPDRPRPSPHIRI